MSQVEISDAGAELGTLVRRVQAGEEVVLAEGGMALAKIVPLGAAPAARWPRRLGLAEGEFVIPEDFDRPLPDDILDAFEGR